MSIVVYWPDVMRVYGASVVAVAPEDHDRFVADIAADVAGGRFDGEDAALLTMTIDPSLSGLDCIEYRNGSGTVLGRAKAR